MVRLPSADENQTRFLPETAGERQCPDETCGADELRLRRWLDSFASGGEWYPVGEYVALDATAAINRAIEVLGAGAGYRAEEIPWDAAPLPRLKVREKKN